MSAGAARAALPAGLKVSECRSCHAPVVWVKTDAGRLMPLDARPLVVFKVDEKGDPPRAFIFSESVFQSHFVTCPNADQHRKKR